MSNQSPVSTASYPQLQNQHDDGPLFSLGRTVATPGALAHCDKHDVSPQFLLSRHVHGDWGDVDDADCDANERALINGDRLLSVYKIATEKIYIFTEGNRSLTSIIMATAY